MFGSKDMSSWVGNKEPVDIKSLSLVSWLWGNQKSPRVYKHLGKSVDNLMTCIRLPTTRKS